MMMTILIGGKERCIPETLEAVIRCFKGVCEGMISFNDIVIARVDPGTCMED